MHGIKRDSREIPHPFHQSRTQWKAIYEPRRGLLPDIQSASTLILDRPTSRIVWNKFLLFISDTVYGILLEQLALTKRAPILTSDPFVMWAGWDWSSFVLSCHHLRGPRWPFSLPAPGFTELLRITLSPVIMTTPPPPPPHRLLSPSSNSSWRVCLVGGWLSIRWWIRAECLSVFWVCQPLGPWNPLYSVRQWTKEKVGQTRLSPDFAWQWHVPHVFTFHSEQ